MHSGGISGKTAAACLMEIGMDAGRAFGYGYRSAAKIAAAQIWREA